MLLLHFVFSLLVWSLSALLSFEYLTIFVNRFMDLISTTWNTGLNPNTEVLSPGLVSYGGDSDNFLECVPSYIHAIAGLQAANTWMMRTAADVADTIGNGSRANELRDLALLTENATLGLYVASERCERAMNSASIGDVSIFILPTK